MKNDTAQYAYTKAVRFKLEQERGDNLKPNTQAFKLQDLIEECKTFACNVKRFIYIKNKGDIDTIDKFITVNKSWLKMHFKNDFYIYNHNTKRNDFSIESIEYAKEGLKQWCENWEKHIKDMQNYASTKDHEKARRADIATTILALSSKVMFPLIHDFVNSANHKNDSQKLKKLIEDSRKLSEILENARLNFLPKQNAGLVVAPASTNYYMVNKKPKEYDKEIKDFKQQLNGESKSYYYDQNKGELHVGDATFSLKREEKAWFDENGNNTPYSLDGIYNTIKQFKARMKSLFYEQVKQDIDVQTLQKNFYLFDNTECLEGFIEKDKKLANFEEEYNKNKNEKSKNHNPSYTQERTKIKKQRGSYLIKEKNNKYFKNWVRLCDAYKKIAHDRGKLNAQIKGIEKEKLEATNNQYWALIYSNSHDKYLWLIPIIPRDNILDAKNEIKTLHKPNNQQPQDSTLYITHSLTMRAFHKLCFAEQSTFVKGMPDGLKCKQQEVNRATDDTKELEKRQRKNIHEKSKTELMLPFLKEVINSEYAKNILELEHFDLTKLQETKSLRDFEQALEHACYYIEQKTMSDTQQERFITQHNISTFKITSYDLEGRNKDTHQTPASKQRRHTKEVWNKFWSGDKTIRLNPEIKIRFREKDKELHQYLANKGFDMEKINNRFLQDQHTINLTFALNAGNLHPQLAFAKTENILEAINTFNNTFNKQNWEGSYRYGIDRGNKELSTLCIAKFNKDDYQHDGQEFSKPSFPNGEDDIKCYELEKKRYAEKAISNLETKPLQERKEKRVVANLSYFIDKIDDKDWFSEKTCTCIDLTTAKLIKDKIILNGDILTFLKLKKEAAKRIIFNLVSEGKIKTKNDLKWEGKQNNGLVYQDRKENGKSSKNIYFYEDRFEGLIYGNNYEYTKDKIKNTFEKYVTELLENKTNSKNKDEHTPSMVKINHLRDALVANMVGVIFHLQKYYPGIVMLEDLDKDNIDERFDSLNISISRRLEWALYKKFQTLGKVPPHVKDIIDIRERVRKSGKSSHQIGAMVYVDKTNTSQDCPHCEKKSPQTSEEKFGKNPKYKCKNEPCGFDTDMFKDANNIKDQFKFLQDIDDPDKVAAYNIAKKIQDYKDIKELSILKKPNNDRDGYK